MPLSFVTLTTDFGRKDYYAAALKVKLLQACDKSVTLLDVTHEIEKFNIAQAAYQVKSILDFFPEGSVHCIDVSSGVSEAVSFSVMKFKGQFIVACDTGLPKIILGENQPEEFVKLDLAGIINYPSFPALDVFPWIVKHLFQGGSIESLGERSLPQDATILRPLIHSKSVRASVIHVDSYDNLVINLQRNDFTQLAQGRQFIMQVRRGSNINNLCSQYMDVAETDYAAFFNTGGYLEVAINKGNMAGINNIQIGDIVQIDFI